MRSRTVLSLRHFSKYVKNTTFITTPIYYVNASPHIGHLYSSLIADATQRWKRMCNNSVSVIFSTGTDEHGSKIQQAALNKKTSLRVYCDDISSQFKRLSDEFSIEYTNYIRTTSEQHTKTIEKLWTTLSDKNYIYSSTYKGWYCVSDETFLPESQIKEVLSPDGRKILVSVDSGHSLEWTEEQNYMFKLSSFKEDLLKWLRTSESIVRPAKFQKILLDLISAQEEDLSVSRPSSRVHWGILVPGDPSQTIYVWLDALGNYLTAAKYLEEEIFKNVWPPDLQVIGKDILKFHGIYWPAFLMAAGLEPPKTILCHSHWTVDGEKMSKSKGNVVCPFETAKMYSTDGLRYFLLREGVAHSDGNYSDTKIMRYLNSELADTLGNLLSRCTGVALNPFLTFPKINSSTFQSVLSLDVTKSLLESVDALPDTCRQHYDDLNFYKAVDSIMATLRANNLFFETLKPWELKKNATSQEELKVVLHLTLETLRVAGILLQPIIPNLSKTLLDKLSIPENKRNFRDVQAFSWNNIEFEDRQLSSDKVVLFRRILNESVKKTILKK